MRGIIAGIMASQIRRPKPILATYPYPIMESDSQWTCRPNIISALTRDTLKQIVPTPAETTYTLSTAAVSVNLRSLTQLGYGGGDVYLAATGVVGSTLRDLVLSTSQGPFPYLAATGVVGAELKVVVVYSEYVVEPFAYLASTAIKSAELTDV
ncbi:tail fiber protein [Pseudomonas phage vB_Pae_S1]|nr:tail fiber protein [Pseudomonas phage vB_Pae_S1]